MRTWTKVAIVIGLFCGIIPGLLVWAITRNEDSLSSNETTVTKKKNEKTHRRRLPYGLIFIGFSLLLFGFYYFFSGRIYQILRYLPYAPFTTMFLGICLMATGNVIRVKREQANNTANLEEKEEQGNSPVSSNAVVQQKRENESPMQILKLRLAKGEISKEEYGDLRMHIEGQ